MDNLPSTSRSFSCQLDNQIDNYLRQWQSDFNDILLQPSINEDRSHKLDQVIPSKLIISSLFDIPLPELKIPTSAREKANRYAEQQLNRNYAIELDPNEKLGDFHLRVPQMAIEVQFNMISIDLSTNVSYLSIHSNWTHFKNRQF